MNWTNIRRKWKTITFISKKSEKNIYDSYANEVNSKIDILSKEIEAMKDTAEHLADNIISSVVAEEVRKLAEHTASSVEVIESLIGTIKVPANDAIGEIQEVTENASKQTLAVEDTKESFREMQDSISKINWQLIKN